MNLVEGITLCALVGVGLGVRAILKGQRTDMETLEEVKADLDKLGTIVADVAELVPSLKASNEAKDAIIADLTAKLAAAGSGLTLEQQNEIDAIGTEAKDLITKMTAVVPDVQPAPATEPTPPDAATPTTTDQAP